MVTITFYWRLQSLTTNLLPDYTVVLMKKGLKWLQCPVCKETISWQLPADELKKVKRFPAPIVIKHKDHHLIVYVDSHYQLADTEAATACVEGASKS